MRDNHVVYQIRRGRDGLPRVVQIVQRPKHVNLGRCCDQPWPGAANSGMWTYEDSYEYSTHDEPTEA
jgi:hypothetical protein